jgi:transposase InsO family protein
MATVRTGDDLIHYTSHTCRQRIEKAGVLVSYTRPGNSHDNVQAEASWNSLKMESLPSSGAFNNSEKAPLEVAYYLDTYFKPACRRSAQYYVRPTTLKLTH